MAYTVIVKKRFTKKVTVLLKYLEKEWGKKTAVTFENKLHKRILQLAGQPYMGKPSEVFTGVRSVLVTRHNRMYYRVRDNIIEIINLYDMRRNPKKNPFQAGK
jgi:plasmid stabilization system protein ParE